MISVLQREAASGFTRLAGTHLTGTIPLGEGVVNDLIGRLPQVPPGFTLEVGAGNRLVARYGLVRAEATLDEVVQTGGEAPRVTIQLSSRVVAWALSRAVRLPAVGIEGRRVTIDLGAVEGAAGFRPYWTHLQNVRLRTTPGQVHVDFEVAVP